MTSQDITLWREEIQTSLSTLGESKIVIRETIHDDDDLMVSFYLTPHSMEHREKIEKIFSEKGALWDVTTMKYTFNNVTETENRKDKDFYMGCAYIPVTKETVVITHKLEHRKPHEGVPTYVSILGVILQLFILFLLIEGVLIVTRMFQ